MKTAEEKLNQLIDDLSDTELSLQTIYQAHFKSNQSQQKIAIELLNDIRQNLKTGTPRPRNIAILKDNSQLNKVIFSSAKSSGVEDIYEGIISDQNSRIYFGIEKSGKLVLFIPINEGQKGIITI